MPEAPEFTDKYVDLASPGRGGAVISVTDEFFAPAKRMLSAGDPVFIPDRFDHHGKWMDGWESRRRRDGGHDACVLRICPGVIRGIEIDTRHFTGNFPPAASVEACRVDSDPNGNTQWTALVPRTELRGDHRRFIAISDDRSWTHLRLNIFPDGGIARLRVYGEPLIEETPVAREDLADLVSETAGGRALQCNNMHFGNMDNLLAVKPVANMGDGWETRRRRDPGNDWVILRLGRPGRIQRIEVDTAFFKGNHPAACSLSGARVTGENRLAEESAGWAEILPRVALGPDQLHAFESQLHQAGVVTHVRFDIYPDGGVARLRLLGVPAVPEPAP